MKLIADYSKRIQAKCSVFVTFPYRALYVDIMKQMPTRFFHAKEKCWEFPLTDAKKLIGLLEQNHIEYNQKEYKQTIEDLNNNLKGAIQKVEHNLDVSVLDRVKFKTDSRYITRIKC